MAGQGGQRHVGQPGGGVVVPQEDAEFAPQQRADLQPGHIAGMVDEPHVETPCPEAFELLGGGQLVQLQLRAGLTLTEVRQERGDGLAGDVGRECGAQQSALPVANPPRGGQERVGAAEDLAGLRQQQSAAVGDRHLPAGALEEPDAQFALQALNALRQRRLAHAQAGCRPAEM